MEDPCSDGGEEAEQRPTKETTTTAATGLIKANRLEAKVHWLVHEE